MISKLKKRFSRFSVNIDLKGSCLEGIAKVSMGLQTSALLAYEYCIVPYNADRSLSVSFAYRKRLNINKLIPNEIDNFDFPMIDFQ